VDNPRKYGKPPYTIVVVHGGPGGPGGMANVARKLSAKHGVLEPLQTKDSIKGQIEELRSSIEKHCELPITLVGHSWGAWLCYLLTANHSALVKKLILVASGPFEHLYSKNIESIRNKRLTKIDKKIFQEALKEINNKDGKNKNNAFSQLGKIALSIDSYGLITHKDEILEHQYNIFNSVWPEAAKLRKSGQLLKFASQIKCPVVAIHGDYDPHPSEGVKIPLEKIINNFNFYLLKNCGHYPWYEKESRKKFFKILDDELK